MEDHTGVSLPRIGALFVASGLITQTQLDACLRLQTETHPDLPLGQILLRYGYVSAEDLARVLVLQRATCPHCGYHSHMPTARFCGGCGIALGVTCASCGLIQVADRIRCAQCDQPLPRSCAECGSLNLPDARFCANCSSLLSDGEGPSPLLALRGQRRRVSVMFADIRGFTTFAHQLDSEQVYLMVDGLLRLLAEEVQRFGGAIDKFTGDGLMATFGAVRSLEHHAAQAIKAGLAMQEVAQRYGDTMEQSFGSRLGLRIGINSGTVVAGELGSSRTRDYTVLGDTVNLASRLESAAQPGTVLVSDAVREQATPNFTFKAREPLNLKGYDQPVQAYEVVGQRALFEREAQHVDAVALYGRDQELALILELSAGLAQGHGAAGLIAGEAGYGKTRLIQELHRQLAGHEVRLVEVHGQPHSQMIPYRLIQELIWQLLGLSEQSGGPVAADMLAQAIGELLGAVSELDDVVAAIQHLLGVGPYKPELRQRIEHLEPAQRKLQITVAAAALLDAIISAPTLVVVEDLHWVDRLSRELLASLGSLLARRPLLICATTRLINPEAIEEFVSGLTQGGTRVEQITLAPLEAADMGALLVERTRGAPLPAGTAERLIARAEGNPLFMEELVRTLLDPGRQDEALLGERQLEDVPESLQEIVMTRFDRLSSRARRVIALAAVIGLEVQEDVLLGLLPGASAGRWADQLQELEEAHLLVREPQRPGTYIFGHVLAQETLYQSMLQSDRETIHDRIAELLLARIDCEEHLASIAYHLRHGTNRIAAVPFLARVGDRAAGQYAKDAALDAYRKALSLIETLEPDHPLTSEILGAMGNVLFFVGSYDEARSYYQRALALADEDTPEYASLLRRIGSAYLRQGILEPAQETFHRALKVIAHVEGPEVTVERARIADDFGWTCFRAGDRAQAAFWLEHALTLVKDDERRLAERASIYNRLGGICYVQGNLEAAVAYTKQALQLREQMGALDGVARSSGNLGVLSFQVGEWDEALTYFRLAAETQRRIGDREGLTIALQNLAYLYIERGECETAHDILQELDAIVGQFDSGTLPVLVEREWARLALKREAWPEASRRAREGLHDEISDTQDRIFYLTVLAEASMMQGHMARACAAARTALALVRKLGADTLLTRALRVRGEVLLANGELARARAYLQKTIEHANLDIPLEQARAKLALAQIAHREGDAEQQARIEQEARLLLERLGVPAEPLRKLLTNRTRHPLQARYTRLVRRVRKV